MDATLIGVRVQLTQRSDPDYLEPESYAALRTMVVPAGSWE